MRITIIVTLATPSNRLGFVHRYGNYIATGYGSDGDYEAAVDNFPFVSFK